MLKDGPSLIDPFELDHDYRSTFEWETDVEPEHPEMAKRITAAAKHSLEVIEKDPKYQHVKSVLVRTQSLVSHSSSFWSERQLTETAR